MMNEQHIMIDLETLSNRPETGIIMSLAAVKFDPYVGPLIDCSQPIPLENAESDDELYYIIDVEQSTLHGYTIEPDTYNWWVTDPERVMEYHRMMGYSRSVSLLHALQRLTAFARKDQRADVQTYGWSHGAGYDMVFISERYRQLCAAGDNPFDHHNIMDTRTVLAMHRQLRDGDVVWQPARMKHHPIDDARRQARAVQDAIRNFRSTAARAGC